MTDPAEELRVDLREQLDGRAAERKRARQAELVASIISAQSETTDDENFDALVDLIAEAVIAKLSQPHQREPLWT